MKKTITLLSIMIITIIINTKAENYTAKSIILIETTTNQTLYQKEIHTKHKIAGLTKLMTLNIIFENIENNKIKLDDIVTISKKASLTSGTKMYLEENEKMKVETLIKGIVMMSANDAAVALAEQISGKEENFILEMNQKAKKLNLKNTHFQNVTGLDNNENYSSAYDLSIISKELLTHDILKYTTIYEDYIRKGTKNELWLVNTNKLIKRYKYTKGLLSGYTPQAKHTLSIYATNNKLNLLLITLGEENKETSYKNAIDLLEYGFNNYKINKLKLKNDKISELTKEKTTPNKIDLILEKDINILENINDTKEYNHKIIINNINNNIAKNEIIGKYITYYNNKIINETNIIAKEKMNRMNYFQIFINILKSFIIGNKI